MKKFRFRLERVLQYRELVKRDRKRDLLHKTNELLEEKQRLGQLEQAWEGNQVAAGWVTVELLQLVEQYSLRLKDEIERQEQRVEKAAQALEEARNAYIEAAKDAEALNTLKRKKREEYMEYFY